MKITLIAVIALAITTSAFAQKEKAHPSFGEITPDELNMKTYAMDTAANAVILFDVGSCSLDDDLRAIYKRHVRIKFFGAKEIDEYASKILTYETSNESITKIKGATYNMENGKIVTSEMSDDAIFKNKVDRIYSQTKFTLPNVKPGSVIEYSYQWTMAASLLPSWQFQHTIPTIYSEYETIIPKTFTFRKDLQGFLPITDQSSKNDGAIEKLIMRDAPAFKVEPFLTTPDDYVSKIHYYITSIFSSGNAKFYNFERSWRGIGTSYDRSPDFGGLTRSTGWLDKTVDPLLVGATTPEEKAKRIHDFVKTNIAWNDLIDRIPDHTLKKVLDEKKGSSSEINMLMVAMMKRAELDAYPVLISTRDNGLIRPFTPYDGQFNNVICLVRFDGKEKFFDGTDKTLPFNSLPERCLNGQGLLVKTDASEWVTLTSSKSRNMYAANFKLNNDGEMTGKLTISRDGLFAGQMRSDFTSLGKEKYLSESFSHKGWEFSKSDFANMEGINEVPKEEHEIVIRDHAQANGDIIYVNPYVAGLETNEFKSEQRQYPVNIPTAFDDIYSAKIEIPEGYKVEELPANKMFILPEGGGKFIYSISVLGNAINFTSQFTISKNFVDAEKYQALREFYSVVVAKQAEQIVLKKAQ
jgi:hypothetical protein